MTVNTVLTIVLVVVTLFILGAGIYFYVRDKSLAEIRADVYQLFLKAEHNPKFAESGKQKMKWVLSRARMLLPAWLQILITDVFLEKVIEGWFRAIKDLLDDGKINRSIAEVADYEDQ